MDRWLRFERTQVRTDEPEGRIVLRRRGAANPGLFGDPGAEYVLEAHGERVGAPEGLAASLLEDLLQVLPPATVARVLERHPNRTVEVFDQVRVARPWEPLPLSGGFVDHLRGRMRRALQGKQLAVAWPPHPEAPVGGGHDIDGAFHPGPDGLALAEVAIEGKGYALAGEVHRVR